MLTKKQLADETANRQAALDAQQRDRLRMEGLVSDLQQCRISQQQDRELAFSTMDDLRRQLSEAQIQAAELTSRTTPALQYMESTFENQRQQSQHALSKAYQYSRDEELALAKARTELTEEVRQCQVLQSTQTIVAPPPPPLPQPTPPPGLPPQHANIC